MTDQQPPSSVDPYKLLRLVPNPDGTLTRLPTFPSLPATSSDPNSLVLSKDIPLNPTHQTSLRLYKPTNLPSNHRLPLLIYIHGGGFVFFSPASAPFHQCCSSLSLSLPAIVLSLDYRLAPEHRLPAAYNDAVSTLLWVQQQPLSSSGEPWLKNHVNFSKCFLMGNSSGGNILYHAALRASSLNLSPIVIRGPVLHQPYFGGVQRTETEVKLANDRVLPLVVNDLLWELSLPEGADRDHEYCNPLVNGGDGRIGRLPRSLVCGFEGDPLVDRQKGFVGLLESRGVHVRGHFKEGGCHGVEVIDPSRAEALYETVKEFICCDEGGDGDAVAKSAL